MILSRDEHGLPTSDWCAILFKHFINLKDLIGYDCGKTLCIIVLQYFIVWFDCIDFIVWNCTDHIGQFQWWWVIVRHKCP